MKHPVNVEPKTEPIHNSTISARSYIGLPVWVTGCRRANALIRQAMGFWSSRIESRRETIPSTWRKRYMPSMITIWLLTLGRPTYRQRGSSMHSFAILALALLPKAPYGNPLPLPAVAGPCSGYSFPDITCINRYGTVLTPGFYPGGKEELLV